MTWQFAVYTRRAISLLLVRQIFSVLFYLFVIAFGAVILSTSLPSATFNDLRSQFAFGCLLITIVSHFGGLPIFGSNSRIAERENDSGLSVLAYAFASDLVASVKVFLYTTFFSVQFPLTDPLMTFREYFVTLLGLSFAATGSGMFLSALFKISIAQMTSVLLSFLYLILAGYVPYLNNIWDSTAFVGRVLTSLSPIRWAYDLLISGEYDSVTEFWQVCSETVIWGGGVDPMRDTWGHGAVMKFAALIGLGLLTRILTYIALHYRLRMMIPLWAAELQFFVSSRLPGTETTTAAAAPDAGGTTHDYEIQDSERRPGAFAVPLLPSERLQPS